MNTHRTLLWPSVLYAVKALSWIARDLHLELMGSTTCKRDLWVVPC